MRAGDLAAPTPATQRRRFIDQCRGYAVFGMILVNVLGLFERMPWMLKHHAEGFSYADHIAPLFIFVVGIGFRMSYQKTARNEGVKAARRRAVRRYAILMGLGLLFGGFHLRAAVWDALMDIGAGGMLALPFMGAPAWARLVVATLYLTLYQGFFSCAGYGDWVMANSINGGPLGPLSWSFILLSGTIAADCVFTMRRARMFMALLSFALALVCAGWLLRMEWPGVKAFWPFSQFAMSAPYTLYAAGLCFLSLLFFYIVSEQCNIAFPHFTVLGRNPLVLYLLQGALVLIVRVAVPSNIPIAAALVCFAVVYGVCYAVAWRLHRTDRIIKI